MQKRIEDWEKFGHYKRQGDCHIWQGYTDAMGYPFVQGGGGNARRMSYRHYNGKIAPGSQIFASCKNRLCVNPAHLVAKVPRLAYSRIISDWREYYRIDWDTNCWLWTRSFGNKGYPSVYVVDLEGKRKRKTAAGPVYEDVTGVKIPLNAYPRRICSDRRCIAPHHMEICTGDGANRKVLIPALG